jgi:hypothetical protein
MGSHHKAQYHPDGKIDEASLNETSGISIHFPISSCILIASITAFSPTWFDLGQFWVFFLILLIWALFSLLFRRDQEDLVTKVGSFSGIPGGFPHKLFRIGEVGIRERVKRWRSVDIFGKELDLLP